MRKWVKLVVLMMLPAVVGMAILEPIYLTLIKHSAQERLVKLRERGEEGIRGRLKAELALMVQEANLEHRASGDYSLAVKHLKELASELPDNDQLVVIAENPGQPNVQTVLVCSAFPEYEGQPAGIDPGERLPRAFVNNKIIQRKMAPNGRPAASSPFDQLVAASQAGPGEVRLLWPKPKDLKAEPNTAYPVLAEAQRVPSLGWVVATGAYTDWIDPVIAHESHKYRSMVSKFLQWMVTALAFLLILAVAFHGPASRLIASELPKK